MTPQCLASNRLTCTFGRTVGPPSLYSFLATINQTRKCRFSAHVIDSCLLQTVARNPTTSFLKKNREQCKRERVLGWGEREREKNGRARRHCHCFFLFERKKDKMSWSRRCVCTGGLFGSHWGLVPHKSLFFLVGHEKKKGKGKKRVEGKEFLPLFPPPPSTRNDLRKRRKKGLDPSAGTMAPKSAKRVPLSADPVIKACLPFFFFDSTIDAAYCRHGFGCAL